jgi:2-polyprenyl-3-methyl-5-hydroxy-6-metoxy-1,4-benzoquinol methylase
MTDDESAWWNDAYRDEQTPWETEQPQPALVDVDTAGGLSGRILDVGCGIGTEALYFADQGYEVTGVDFAEAAVERARERRATRPLAGAVQFRVADALALSETDLGPFETALDCGMFHTSL